MFISVDLVRKFLDQALELGERVATAMEVIAGLRPPPPSREKTVTYAHLHQFVAGQPRGANKGQAAPLWGILIGSDVGFCIAAYHLPPIGKGDELDVAGLRALVGSRCLFQATIPGLGKARHDLLIRWVASL
jgi:hypothetical protein